MNKKISFLCIWRRFVSICQYFFHLEYGKCMSISLHTTKKKKQKLFGINMNMNECQRDKEKSENEI